MLPLLTRALRNWPLKLVALTLSIIVWVLVSAEETTTLLIAVPLDLTVPASLALTRTPPQVRALVSGPGRELIKLYATPLAIRRAVPASATGRWRMPISPTDVDIPIDAKISVQDVEPREVTIELDRLTRRMVPVALRGTVSARNGWTLEPLAMVPAEVRVSGPRALVAELDSVHTEPVDVHDVTDRFERTIGLDTARHALLRVAPGQVTLVGRARRP